MASDTWSIERLAATALVIIDVQVDFCPGGALAVAGGDEVVGPINHIAHRFGARVLTQDWHPADHSSFASQHPGKAPFDAIEVDYGTQVLWPDHCIQGTRGATIHPDLETGGSELLIRKGFRRGIDSYSAFFENDRTTRTGLEGYLRERGFEDVALVGLATDFCVRWSACDAASRGFNVTVFEDACRAIDLNGSLAEARAEMAEKGVVATTTDTL